MGGGKDYKGHRRAFPARQPKPYARGLEAGPPRGCRRSRPRGTPLLNAALNTLRTPCCSSCSVLLVIVAFSSGTEVAMLSVNRFRIRHRAQAGTDAPAARAAVVEA